MQSLKIAILTVGDEGELINKKCFSLYLFQADMHGLLTFVLIPSTQSKPPPVKENVVSSEPEQNFCESMMQKMC